MIEFPYILRKGKLYPIIPITLGKGRFRLKTQALVDSGATISVFRSSIADYFNIDVEAGKRITLQGVGGRIVGYVHRIALEVDAIRFWSPIAFSEELTTTINILGRDNFFQHFLVSFDEQNRKTVLKPIA